MGYEIDLTPARDAASASTNPTLTLQGATDTLRQQAQVKNGSFTLTQQYQISAGTPGRPDVPAEPPFDSSKVRTFPNSAPFDTNGKYPATVLANGQPMRLTPGSFAAYVGPDKITYLGHSSLQTPGMTYNEALKALGVTNFDQLDQNLVVYQGKGSPKPGDIVIQVNDGPNGPCHIIIKPVPPNPGNPGVDPKPPVNGEVSLQQEQPASSNIVPPPLWTLTVQEAGAGLSVVTSGLNLNYGTSGLRVDPSAQVAVRLGDGTVPYVRVHGNSAIPQAQNALVVGVDQRVGGTTANPITIGAEGQWIGALGEVPLGYTRRTLSVDGQPVESTVRTVNGQAVTLALTAKTTLINDNNDSGTRLDAGLSAGYRISNNRGLENGPAAAASLEVSHQVANDENFRIGLTAGADITQTVGQNGNTQGQLRLGVAGSFGPIYNRPAVNEDFRPEPVPQTQKQAWQGLGLVALQTNPTTKALLEQSPVKLQVIRDSAPTQVVQGNERLMTTVSTVGDPKVATVPVSSTTEVYAGEINVTRGSEVISLKTFGVQPIGKTNAQTWGAVAQEIKAKIAAVDYRRPLKVIVNENMPQGFAVDNRSLGEVIGATLIEATRQAEAEAASQAPTPMGLSSELAAMFPAEALITTSSLPERYKSLLGGRDQSIVVGMDYNGQKAVLLKGAGALEAIKVGDIDLSNVGPESVVKLNPEQQELLDGLVSQHIAANPEALATATGSLVVGDGTGAQSVPVPFRDGTAPTLRVGSIVPFVPPTLPGQLAFPFTVKPVALEPLQSPVEAHQDYTNSLPYRPVPANAL